MALRGSEAYDGTCNGASREGGCGQDRQDDGLLRRSVGRCQSAGTAILVGGTAAKKHRWPGSITLRGGPVIWL